MIPINVMDKVKPVAEPRPSMKEFKTPFFDAKD
jgi:hypothetical protein